MKEEIYDMIDEFYDKQSQGLLLCLIREEYHKYVEELVEEGRVKKNIDKFNYLPDSVWLIPIK